MPYTLTSAEKQALRNKYRQNVETINRYLNEEYKIKLDMDAFNKRLNNPQEVRLYKKGMQLRKKQDAQRKIADDLIKKHIDLKDPKSYTYSNV